MPSKHIIKKYISDGYYHIYNRGVEKRKIFQNEQDYKVFLFYLKTYLEPKNTEELQKQLTQPNLSYKRRAEILKILRLNNFHNEIQLLSFCLMPNHFHLLLKQKSSNGIDIFMQSLATRYSMYFNKKYKRVGPLFQGLYKAVLVSSDEQLLHLSRYIHKNPAGHSAYILKRNDLSRSYSSYKNYLGEIKTDWLKTELILSHFSKTNPQLTYRAFVEGAVDSQLIQKLVLE